MKSKPGGEGFAAFVERHIAPLLEDSMGNKKEGYEMNTKHTPEPWVAHIEPGYSHYEITAGVNQGPFVVDIIARLPLFRPQFNGPPDEQVANAALIVAAPDMAAELARGRATLCALRYWVPEDLLPTVNRVIVNMAHAIGKATGDCLPEADGRTEEAARAAIEEVAK